jgi:hypothetical protein
MRSKVIVAKMSLPLRHRLNQGRLYRPASLGQPEALHQAKRNNSHIPIDEWEYNEL